MNLARLSTPWPEGWLAKAASTRRASADNQRSRRPVASFPCTSRPSRVQVPARKAAARFRATKNLGDIQERGAPPPRRGKRDQWCAGARGRSRDFLWYLIRSPGVARERHKRLSENGTAVVWGPSRRWVMVKHWEEIVK